MIISLQDGTKLNVPDGSTPDQLDEVVDHYTQNVAKPSTSTADLSQKDPSFMQRLQGDFDKRVGNISDSLMAQGRGEHGNIIEGLQQTGQIAGFLGNDIPAQALHSIASVIPQPIKDAGSYVFDAAKNTPEGRVAMLGLGAANIGMSKYNDYAQNHPDAARNIDAVANIGGLVGAFTPIGEGKSLVGAGLDATQAAGSIAKNITAAGLENVIPEASLVNKAGSIQGLSDIAKEASQKYYQVVDNSGYSLPVEHTQNWIEKAQSVRPDLEAVKKTGQLDDVDSYLQSLNNLKPQLDEAGNVVSKGHSLTFPEAQAFDKKLGDLVFDNSENGILNAKGRDYLNVKRSLIDSLENAPGSEDYKSAVKNYAIKSRLDDLARLDYKAKLSNVPQTVIRNGAKSLALSGAYRGEELAALERATKTGVLGGLTNVLGSKLLASIAGTVSGASLGGVGAIVGGLGGAAASEFPKALAGKLQTNRLKDVANIVGKGIKPYSKGDLEAAFQARKAKK